MVASRLEACKGLWECGGVEWEGILGSPYLGGACGLGLYLGKREEDRKIRVIFRLEEKHEKIRGS